MQTQYRARAQSVIQLSELYRNSIRTELRPVERARAYLQKKMLKKALREDAGADVLRNSACSAHVSG